MFNPFMFIPPYKFAETVVKWDSLAKHVEGLPVVTEAQ